MTFLTTGLFGDGSYAQLEGVRSIRGHMDSGDTVDLTCVLLKPEHQDQPMPLVAITIVVLGYEIDNQYGGRRCACFCDRRAVGHRPDCVGDLHGHDSNRSSVGACEHGTVPANTEMRGRGPSYQIRPI